jgi:enediyne biosynthesis protein E4
MGSALILPSKHLFRTLLAVACLLAGCSNPPAPVTSAPQAGPSFFEDVTKSCGIDHTYHDGQEAGLYAILESLGGGVGLIDYDGDDLLDIFLPGGGSLDETTISGLPGKLYRNLGDWKFKDVTASVMPEQAIFYTHGCAVADYDCDGWSDLLVTGWGRVALYHNEPADPTDETKGRRLSERAETAGLAPVTWGTSAAWADFDGDGYPDLYLCQYVDWSLTNNPRCKGYSAGVDRDVCPPAQFVGLPHLLFRNNANGTFTEVGKEAGLRVLGVTDDKGNQVGMGKGLGVIAADLNDDTRPDIYVANDTVDNFLYLNRDKFQFEEVGLLSGVARDDHGMPNGSMGIAVGDYNRTGRASIFVTNYENEMHALYRSLGRESFHHSTSAAGIAALGQKFVAFGTSFVDLDHHGWQDLVIANGHVIRHPASTTLAQSPVLLRNTDGSRFQDISQRGGGYFEEKHVARGLAVGDLDNDGRLDAVISHINQPVAVLRNVADTSGNHWLGLSLSGENGRDLVGTKVVVEADGKRFTRFVVGGGSYLSAHDPRLVIGLGGADRVTNVSITWSHGGVEDWDGAAFRTDQYWRISAGKPGPLDKP